MDLTISFRLKNIFFKPHILEIIPYKHLYIMKWNCLFWVSLHPLQTQVLVLVSVRVMTSAYTYLLIANIKQLISWLNRLTINELPIAFNTLLFFLSEHFIKKQLRGLFGNYWDSVDIFLYKERILVKIGINI